MEKRIKFSSSSKSFRLETADNLYTRMLGLMFRREMSEDYGLMIEPGNSIHTFFMRFSLDLVFITKENKVHKIFRNVKPWRMTRIYFKSKKVLELNAGTLPDEVQIGDKVEEYV